MNKALEKFEIDILNFPQFEETFSKMTLKERERMIIPEDGHPSFEASQLLANELSELLNNL